MECKNPQAFNTVLRSVILIPGPQCEEFSQLEKAILRRYPLEARALPPFVLVGFTQAPLSLEALRELGRQIRTADTESGLLHFEGPLEISELFGTVSCLSVRSRGSIDSYSPPLSVPALGLRLMLCPAPSDNFHPGEMSPVSVHIHQGHLCNAVLSSKEEASSKSIRLDCGRAVWLPSRRRLKGEG